MKKIQGAKRKFDDDLKLENLRNIEHKSTT